MNAHGVDVRTPIFYCHSFANALEAQSGKVYACLTHTPLIAEHLPRGAVSGALIEQYAAAHLHTLEDLEKLLRTILDETSSSNAGLYRTPASTCEDGGGELNTNILSQPSALLPRGTAPAEVGVSGEEAATVDSRPLRGDADTRRVQPSYPCEGGECTAVHEAHTSPCKLPRSVSFTADPSRTAPSIAAARFNTPEGSAATGDSVRGTAPQLWERLSRWVRRLHRRGSLLFLKDKVLSADGQARRPDSVPAAPLPHWNSSISVGAVVANSTVARVWRSRVPEWVRAAFAPTSTLAATPVSTSISAAQSVRWLHPPVPVHSVSPCGSATVSQRVETRQKTSPDAVAITQSSRLLSTRDLYDGNNTGDGRDHQEDCNDGGAASSHLTQMPRKYTRGPFPMESGAARMSLGIQSIPEAFTSTASHTNVCKKANTSTADARWEHPTYSPSKMMSMSPTATCGVTENGTNPPVSPPPTAASLGDVHGTRPNDSGVRGEHFDERALLLQRHDGGGSRASGGAVDTSSDLRSARHSNSFNHPWNGADAQAPQVQSSATFALRRSTSVTNCRDKHAYAVELTGWLHLLVWVRWQVIHFLRDLSGVQSFVAWSAWYWSWAQEHPRQAAFHQALSSASFWRGLWSHGLHAKLNHVQYEISRHMFTLKSVFQLIVSYIGAAYRALEQLNTLVMQVQRSCEVMMSPMAAAVSAPVVRAPAAAVGSNFTASPVLTNDANAHRGGGGGGDDFNSNPNSMFWSPVMAGMSGGGSPLVHGPRSRAGSPHRASQSSFVGAAAPATPYTHHGLDDESEHKSATSVLEEEAEAASPLHGMDELRRAVWSMLQELKAMLCPDGLPLDVLGGSDQVRFPWSGGGGIGGGPSVAGLPTATTARPEAQGGLHQSRENALLGVSTLGEAASAAHPSGLRVHFAEGGAPGTHGGSEVSGGRQASVREGARVLLQCVQCSRLLLRRLTVVVQRAHSPPASRHWKRIIVATATIVPPFIWVYTKSPAELAAIARQTVMVGRWMLQSYVIGPAKQLRESLFYVRPGVEDRRGAVERDAVSLANVIRDFHEDMYPNMPLKRLEELRQRTFERLRAGVADPDGMGLIDEQYRHSVRHPIRSILFGDLPRIMLIQLSYQALEVSRVANGIDEVLEGNDINFKIMAMMPVFLAGGLLATWSLLRYRSKYKPVRLRMKLLWRSLFRVISFADNGQGLVLPYLRITAQQHGTRHHTDPTALVVDVPHAQTNLAVAVDHPRSRRLRRHMRSAVAAVGTILGSSLPSRNVEQLGSGGMCDTDATAFSESRSDSESPSDESRNATWDAAPARQLNNYEQGMVLLLSHVMRCMAAEYLRSYAFFHELMEDLNDLESVQSTRYQRLETLKRMRATHTYFF
nr:unnamed protein product [Leishmania braziliensis]